MLGYKSKIFLFPYYIALKIRHFLYDKGIKKSHSYPIKTICVGNITVGGTGKTPHCEMIIRLLKDKYDICLLSRGYKRKTKGFRLVEADDTFEKVGDEPLQIKQKFPDITVAVCENRCFGVEKLMNSAKERLIILDDAFQHRKIIPDKSIVLVNYDRPIDKDDLLPIGKLRDLPERIRCADIVIISNYPFRNHPKEDDMSNEDLLKYLYSQEKIWRKKLELSDQQKLFFSAVKYMEPQPVFEACIDKRYLYSKSALIFSGIANDSRLKNYVSIIYRLIDSIKFSDHQNFSSKDIKLINMIGAHNPRSIIITTEKDSKRLYNSIKLSDDVKKRLFYLPIEIEIITDTKRNEFLESVI